MLLSEQKQFELERDLSEKNKTLDSETVSATELRTHNKELGMD